LLRKWLPSIRKLSQGKLEKSQSIGSHDARQIAKQAAKTKFKVGAYFHLTMSVRMEATVVCYSICFYLNSEYTAVFNEWFLRVGNN
jgi:hypothetical protein